MSLLPGEQRALAAIEDSLSNSDPKLAAMLATFTLPPIARLIAGGKHLARPARARCLTIWAVIALMVAAVAVILIVVAG